MLGNLRAPTGDVCPTTRALLAEAQRAWAAGEFDAARSALASAVVVGASAATHYAFAELLTDCGDGAGALRQLELAWDQAKVAQSPHWRALCCHALAEQHRAHGRLDQANRFRQWALRAELDGGEPVAVARWLLDRAEDALHAGDGDDATRLSAAAARIGDAEVVAPRNHCLQGVACARQGRWSAAVRWFVRAFHASRAQQDLRGCSTALLNVARVLFSRGAWQRAAVCFDHAARLLRRVRDEKSAAGAAQRARECRRMWAALHADPQRN